MNARLQTLSGATLLALLAACSSAPPLRGSGAGGTAASPSSPTATQPLPTSRRGGYYADDGPGDNAPVDLAAIPDAQPRREPLLARANRPYVVFGKQYVPMTALAPYRERGVGSWYGRKFHGMKTSSGEPYDMYAMTAAHPTLPIPSFVRVTSVRSGQSVVVRVNDRGPFLHGRLIDLSYTAAAKLGYVQAGSGELEVELVTRFDNVEAPALAAVPAAALVTAAASSTMAPAAVTPVAATPGELSIARGDGSAAPASEPRLTVETIPAQAEPRMTGAPAAPAASAAPAVPAVPAVPGAPATFLQLGAFASRDNAEVARVKLAGSLDWLADRMSVRQEGQQFKLQAGPFARRDDAMAAAQKIRQTTDVKAFPTARP